MKISIDKKVIKTFEDFWTDPYFVEFLSVNAPDYVTAALVIQACEDFTEKLKDRLNEEG